MPQCRPQGAQCPATAGSSGGRRLALLLLAAGIRRPGGGPADLDHPLPQPAVKAGRLTSSVVPGSARSPPVAGQRPGGGGRPGARLRRAVRAGAARAHRLPDQDDHGAGGTARPSGALGSSGPTVTITPDEAAQFDVNLRNDETNIPLQAGETLTELQLLEALLNQSADDAAYTLAVWTPARRWPSWPR